MIGNCIKTGAIVDFYEWGTATPCDLFEVGDCVAIRFKHDTFYVPSGRPVTHKVLIGTTGFLDKLNGFAVVPFSQLDSLWSAQE